MKKLTALLLTGCLTLSVLTGCGKRVTGTEVSPEGETQAAQESGAEENQAVVTEDAGALAGSELNLFTWDGMFPQEILDGFEEETGIRINYSNFDSDEDMLAKLEESEGGDYDLVIADDYIIELVIKEGLAQKLSRDKLSNFDNINPIFQGYFYDENDEYTVPYGAGIPLIVYDPEVTGFEMTSYEDLWNPALQDNVALIANYRVIDGIVLKTLGESFNTNDVAKIEEAGEKLKELAPNVRVINDNNTQDPVERRGRGGLSVHFPGDCGIECQSGLKGMLSEGRTWFWYHGRVYSVQGTQCGCRTCVSQLYPGTGECGQML